MAAVAVALRMSPADVESMPQVMFASVIEQLNRSGGANG